MLSHFLTAALLVALTWARAIITNECQYNVWIWSHPVTGTSHTENIPIKPGGQYQEPWRFGTPDAPGISIKISAQADGLLKLADEIDFAYSIDKHDKSKIWVDLSLVRGTIPYNQVSFHTCLSRYNSAEVDPHECDATDDVELVLCDTTRTMPAKDYASIEQIRACYEPEKLAYRRSSQVTTDDDAGESNQQSQPQSMVLARCSPNPYDCSRREMPVVNDGPFTDANDEPHDIHVTPYGTPYDQPGVDEPHLSESNKPGADKPYVEEPSSHEPASHELTSYPLSSYKPSHYTPSNSTPSSHTSNHTSNHTLPSYTSSSYKPSGSDSSSHETNTDAQNDDKHHLEGQPSGAPHSGIPYVDHPHVGEPHDQTHDEPPVHEPHVNDTPPVHDHVPAFNRCQARVVYPTRRTSPKPRTAPASSMKHREQHPSLCQVVQKYHPGVTECDEQIMKAYARTIYPHICSPQYESLLMGFPCEEIAKELRTVYPGVVNSTQVFGERYGAECECADEWSECFCADAMGTRDDIQDLSQRSSDHRVCLACFCAPVIPNISCVKIASFFRRAFECFGAKYGKLITEDPQHCSSIASHQEPCIKDISMYLEDLIDWNGLQNVPDLLAKLFQEIESVAGQ